jgi:hypothetical protein
LQGDDVKKEVEAGRLHPNFIDEPKIVRVEDKTNLSYYRYDPKAGTEHKGQRLFQHGKNAGDDFKGLAQTYEEGIGNYFTDS